MSKNDHDIEPVPQALEYGQAVVPLRRRVGPALLVIVAIAVVIAIWHWMPVVLQQVAILRWQDRWMNYMAAPSLVVFDSDPREVSKLLNTPGYSSAAMIYLPQQRGLSRGATTRPNYDAVAYRGTDFADNFFSVAAISPEPSGVAAISRPMVRTAVPFVGALKTPSGKTRLIILECSAETVPVKQIRFRYAILDPATLFKPPKLLKPFGPVQVASRSAQVAPPASVHRIYAAHIDPASASSLLIPIDGADGKAVLRASLTDGDVLMMEVEALPMELFHERPLIFRDGAWR